ncbi:uncharacterized protein LOC112571046 [Pomacea canaliculata]|uniref:uncharacterized protein LOC112571046 n=1 Tax=Pomacea canaliculata TaxID=400727 RepID=UPI000D73EBF3|nr:uncharacterized protein LOC112571046 [Pomacea canaliculata]
MKTFLTIFIATLVCRVAEMSSLHPSQREDVMGKYSFMNRYQCERLCWYRKLCKTYTYIYNRTLATGGNCVLHAENISTNTTSGVSTDWVEREAFWDEALQDNGCRNRTCNDTQVCVPTFASPFYACLPLPAECQAPPRDDGVYSNVTLLQGQRTNFTCNPSLVWAPRHADKTVTCQVNGKYSELKGTCKNATYYSPSVPFNKPLPDVVAKEWEACFKGNFTGLQRMTFNFHDRKDASCDSSPPDGGNIYLCLDFRYDFDVTQKVLYFNALNNCSWSNRGEIGNLTLQPNDYFEMTLRILFNNTMQITYNNDTTQQVDLASDINLTNATYLEIVRNVSLSYVNLGRGCD